MNSILEIQDLAVRFETDDGVVKALNGINLKLEEGVTLGLVGETGAGKTTLAKSIMRIIPQPPGKIVSGKILYEGRDLLKMSRAEICKIRGAQISMIFQDPMTSLNPVMTVGDQIAEAIQAHQHVSAVEATQKTCAMMELVGINAERMGDYPHQFSGGMKQRVVIAIALACNPKILIADEPTTALDVTIQAQVLEMMQDLKKKFHTATILITHDLGVVAQTCEKAAIIYAGEIVESGTIHEIFKEMSHPYTIGLMNSIPKINSEERRLNPIDGLMPDPMNLPLGCNFCDRCKFAAPKCWEEEPPVVYLGGEHFVKCFMMESRQRREDWKVENGQQ